MKKFNVILICLLLSFIGCKSTNEVLPQDNTIPEVVDEKSIDDKDTEETQTDNKYSKDLFITFSGISEKGSDYQVGFRSSGITLYNLSDTLIGKSGRLANHADPIHIPLESFWGIDTIRFENEKNLTFKHQITTPPGDKINMIIWEIGYGSLNYYYQNEEVRLGNDLLPNGDIDCSYIVFFDKQYFSKPFYIDRSSYFKTDLEKLLGEESILNKYFLNSINKFTKHELSSLLLVPFDPISFAEVAEQEEIIISLDLGTMVNIDNTGKDRLSSVNVGTPFNLSVSNQSYFESQLVLDMPENEWFKNPEISKLYISDDTVYTKNNKTDESLELFTYKSEWVEVGDDGGYELNIHFTESADIGIESISSILKILPKDENEGGGRVVKVSSQLADAKSSFEVSNHSPRVPRGGYEFLELVLHFDDISISTLNRPIEYY